MLPIGNIRQEEYDYAMAHTPNSIFPIRLRERIDAKSRALRSVYTARDLAEAVGVSGAAISRYLNGERKPSGATLAKIAAELDTTVDHLQGLTGDPRRPGYSSLPSVLFEVAPLVAGLSDDGIEDLRVAVLSVRTADDLRQQDVREREIHSQFADSLLSEEEAKLFTEALLLARSGDMDRAIALVDEILIRFHKRLR